MKQSREKFLHRKSIYLGRAFRHAYSVFGKDHQLTLDLLERYCNVRREIPGESNDGINHSTRYGAQEAYLTTSG